MKKILFTCTFIVSFIYYNNLCIADSVNKNEATAFLNSFVKNKCNFYINNPRVFNSSCQFEIYAEGNFDLLASNYIDGNWYKYNYNKVYLSDMDPEQVSIIEAKGVNSYFIDIKCSLGKNCVNYSLSFENQFEIAKEYTSHIMIFIHEKTDAERIARAFRAAIIAYGGEPDPF